MNISRLAIGLTGLALWIGPAVFAADGYDLWLRYPKIDDTARLEQYRGAIKAIVVEGQGDTYTIIKRELQRGLTGLLDQKLALATQVREPGTVIIGTAQDSRLIAQLKLTDAPGKLGPDGFIIRTCVVDDKACIVIAANRPVGALYGSFRFLQLLQAHRDISQIDICAGPKHDLRMLNHWDNLNGGGERGYAGYSLWKWQDLPQRLDGRYTDYARACASIGINGMVPNNVNADAKSLSTEYLRKLAALADLWRPYGIKVFLAAKWSAPKELGTLSTADPLDVGVIAWWKSKTEEIYGLIPDFGGFLVKANSEGQPGPYDYGRTHAQGANMLAELVRPHGGTVIWRAFVYGKDKPDADRIKQAYQEFVPLDGLFKDNVFVQVKNGPLDFQPREPINPLFGAMPKTRLNMELQITQEYLGHSVYLCYLAPMWKEVLDSPLYLGELDKKPGSDGYQSIIAGVANVGTDRNWCGHHFAQANWFAFGRLAWDPSLDSQAIAQEWARLTFTNDAHAIATISEIMMRSWQANVNFMTPLGLNTLCNAGSGDEGHYSPSPATRQKFHHADKTGLGYDRTSATGSNAVGQYPEPLRTQFDDLDTCPEKYLLWFHHVDWDHRMKSGRTLWDELCWSYAKGVQEVRQFNTLWQTLEGKIDAQRYRHVQDRLKEQLEQAVLWQRTCVDYFQGFSGREIQEFDFSSESL
ncbi:MAG: hypothetical protein LLF76_11600 [Planctomycetaceae bacterium]|nr:hypothetical protein [Planctomycetaceae bacterium]